MTNKTRREMIIAAGLATISPTMPRAQEGADPASLTQQSGAHIRQLANRTEITGDERSVEMFAQIAAKARELPVYSGSVDIEAVRQSGLSFAESPLSYPVPSEIEREWVDAGGVRACWFRRAEYRDAAPVLYLHGGGYVGGSVEASRGIAAKLAESLGAPVLAVAYRQAPEAPYPAAVEDTIAAYQWVTAQTDDPVGLVGDSAGGALAIGMAVEAARAGLRPAAYAIAMSVWLDFSLTGYSWLANRDEDLVTADLGRFFLEAYLADADPAVACAFFFDRLELSPPLLIQMGGVEGPLDSTVAFVERARALGVPVDFEVYAGMPHNFAKFRSPISDIVYENAAEWVRQKFPT